MNLNPDSSKFFLWECDQVFQLNEVSFSMCKMKIVIIHSSFPCYEPQIMHYFESDYCDVYHNLRALYIVELFSSSSSQQYCSSDR